MNIQNNNKINLSGCIGVYLSLNEKIYANNTIILITDIGETDSTKSPPDTNKGLQCITDKMPCCRMMDSRAGEWFFPDWKMVPGPMASGDSGFYRNRGYNDDGTVNLNRRNNVTDPTGLFCCMIPDALNTSQYLCANIGI